MSTIPYSWTLQLQHGSAVTLLIPGNPGILYDGTFGLYSLSLTDMDQTTLDQFLQTVGIQTTWSGGPDDLDQTVTQEQAGLNIQDL